MQPDLFLNRHGRRKLFWLSTHMERDPNGRPGDLRRKSRDPEAFAITENTSPRKLRRYLTRKDEALTAANDAALVTTAAYGVTA